MVTISEPKFVITQTHLDGGAGLETMLDICAPLPGGPAHRGMWSGRRVGIRCWSQPVGLGQKQFDWT